MREFVRSMECNQKLINQLGYSCRGRGSSLFDKWTSIRDYETAKKMLSESTCQVEREKMNRTLYHQAGNSIPVVIFEAMFKAMFEQGIIEVGS